MTIFAMNELQIGEQLDHYRIESLAAAKRHGVHLSRDGRAERPDRGD